MGVSATLGSFSAICSEVFCFFCKIAYLTAKNQFLSLTIVNGQSISRDILF